MVDFPLLFWTGLGRCQSASASNRGWKCFGGKALEEARDSGQPTVQQFARPVQLQCQSTADPPQNKPGLLEEGWNTVNIWINGNACLGSGWTADLLLEMMKGGELS
jgi:hypothetical protein